MARKPPATAKTLVTILRMSAGTTEMQLVYSPRARALCSCVRACAYRSRARRGEERLGERIHRRRLRRAWRVGLVRRADLVQMVRQEREQRPLIGLVPVL